MRLVIAARRFYCDAVLCGQRIFTERFETDVLAPWARRTARLDHIVHHLGLALGGRPAAAFARRLNGAGQQRHLVARRPTARHVAFRPANGDRHRRLGVAAQPALRDDHCDLERRKTIALLPDREPATAQAWLSDQQQISIVARERGGAYALAAAQALPEATQVADRWHLENASRAFLDAVRKSMRQIKTAIGSATINPDLLTAAERIQSGISSSRRHERRDSGLGQVRCCNQRNRSSRRPRPWPRQASATRSAIRRVPRAG